MEAFWTDVEGSSFLGCCHVVVLVQQGRLLVNKTSLGLSAVVFTRLS